MITTYKLSPKSLNNLRKHGLSDNAVRNLEALEDRVFDSEYTFLEQVYALSFAGEFRQKESLILRQAKGYFRLDRMIPNRTIREWVEALLFALIVAGIVRTYVVAPFKIPSGSMLPTIQIGDHIFASMYSYGAWLPFTDEKLLAQPVERGDIVIFPYPRTKPGDPSLDYIKRTVGLAGETLEIREDQVFINGEPLDEPYAFFEGKDRYALGGTRISNFGPVTVPEGKLFVMGDNRYNSADSRFWGFLDAEQVMGKGRFIYWHHDPRESFFSGYRLDRLFSTLQ
jgi:signal peptidase I